MKEISYDTLQKLTADVIAAAEGVEAVRLAIDRTEYDGALYCISHFLEDVGRQLDDLLTGSEART